VAPEARAEALELVGELEAAANSGDRARIAAALVRLDALWRRSLERADRKGAIREIAESVGVALVAALLLRAFVVEAFRIPSASMVPSLQVGDRILVSKLSYGLRLPLADRWLTRWSDARRGDVVVFSSLREPGHDFVKRVVGLPGDTIELRNQVVLVNGVAQPREPAGQVTYEEWSVEAGRWTSETCPLWREFFASPPTADGGARPDTGEASGGRAGVHLVAQCRSPRPGEREGPFERVAPGHVFVMGDNRDRSADSRSEGGWQIPMANVKGKAVVVWWSWGRSGWSPRGGAEGLRVERLFKSIE
jgi:signal peptidase I